MADSSTSGYKAKEVTKEYMALRFEWLRNPVRRAERYDEDELIRRANAYFAACVDNDEQPRLTGLTLALNLPGPASLTRLAMRNPEWRHIVSQCMTAVAHGYECMIQAGVNPAGAVFMLKQIPEFDPEEPVGTKPIQYFTEKREILLDARVHGAVELHNAGADLTPREAYLRVIHGEASDAELEESDVRVHRGEISCLEEILDED